MNASSYALRLEVENSSIIIDSIDYWIAGNETISHMPVLLENISNISFHRGESYALNLSRHFYDEDNDALIFGYYNSSGILVEITDGTAVLASPEFEGTAYMYFTANDSSYTAVSNVFSVEVKEKRKLGFGPGLKSLRKIIGIS